MKLNNDCMRDVLLKIEQLQGVCVDAENDVSLEPLWVEDLYKSLPKSKKEDIFYALFNLDQAGYVKTNLICGDDTGLGYVVSCLTFEGHNFLDKIRDPKAWKYIKTAGAAIGNFSLSVINQIASGVTTAFIDSYIARNPFEL